MSILKKLLNEMTQGEMHFEDSLEDSAEKVAKELLETAVQVLQEMKDDNPDEDLEIDEQTLREHAEGFFEDLYTPDVMQFINRDAKKYVPEADKE